MQRWMLGTSMLIASALTLASCCKRGSGEQPVDTDPGALEPEGSAVTSNVEKKERKALGSFPAPGGPAVARKSGAGAAYFGTQDGTIVKLENGAFSTFQRGMTWIKDITQGPDGTIWVAGPSNIHKIVGGKQTTIRGSGESRAFDEIEVAKDGTVWVSGLYGVSHYDGRSWKLFRKEEIHPDLKVSIDGLEVDDAGRVWIVAMQLIGVYDGGKWTTVSTKGGAAGESLFCKGAALRDGALYTIADGGIVGIGKEWSVLKSTARIDGNDLAAGPTGVFFTGDYKSVSRVQVGKAVETFASGKAFKGEHVQQLAVDQQGRAWFTTDAGLTVIGTDGKSMQWVQGTEPTLSAKVTAVFVADGGPPFRAASGRSSVGPSRAS